MDKIQLDTIPEAVEHLRQGKMIVVVDDEDRENEGDLIGAADLVTPEMINFMTVHARGLVCVPLPEKRCDELGLDIMVSRSSDPKETAFTVSIDLLGNGNSTGISAGDRARTIQAMMSPDTKPSDFMRPGHIFPLRAKEGGVLKRAGHTEASIDLTRLAGLNEGGVICEIMNEDGSMARLPELKKFAVKHDLKIVSIEDLIQYRMKQGDLVERIEEKAIKTHFGDFNFYAYKERHTDQIHYAITKGKWADKEPVLIRVQSSSAYFDIFTRLANGEKPLMEKAIQMVNAEGKGAIVFINNVSDSEKTMNKLQQFLSYQSGNQEKPTIRANYKDYGIGIQILKDLGISNMKVITQSPDQRPIVGGYDVEVSELVELI
ncbi:3,4-dihydroxy-2-butanone-4-phosphate synthase [Elizabethkingia meningoseptica]|uniref:3,4-dihydroxy-2-butanone 4-phosphate synthase n=1 Tax=Elizabethkingia meningoseptica TaxID=238 RepID=A0A1V3U4D1_ELIME|nr:3,4-dihydroxy-2-butanone-4-phosphate synthase [Elizabethkingia meningoseptica]AQX03950.1 3,4-dihydroxy-2-butanone-4-phosphate synthase [Elizabethkingia meningoseptica]AQX11413.1 3,4-dihydroxy-2-butanone-4-phosphate synthase [Elizabethkingia meningoseptica]AQX45990.1 3,4-dihydroxy-2-butanone 4-phosphate synthase [Elizabethkingia meningoseptica]EJK5329248.1 3,4-dihydroxy-2-butanone-4-phosphate synthase [Elizabethkingia meningoseptica]EOR30352.1 3,4-dihydroxy-2-butanone 4-phosphate synthase [E